MELVILSKNIYADKHICSLWGMNPSRGAKPDNAHPPHTATLNPLVEISLSKAMMRGSYKQLISSLFAHMCLTPLSPQWVLALCNETISSANMDNLKEKNNPSSTWAILPLNG